MKHHPAIRHPQHPDGTSAKMGLTTTHRATANERKTVVDREKYRVERRNEQYLCEHLELTQRNVGCTLRFRRPLVHKFIRGLLESISRRTIVPSDGSEPWGATICGIRVRGVLHGVIIDEVRVLKHLE